MMKESEPSLGREIALRCRFGEMSEHQRIYTVRSDLFGRQGKYILAAPTSQVLSPYELTETFKPLSRILTEGWADNCTDVFHFGEEE